MEGCSQGRLEQASSVGPSRASNDQAVAPKQLIIEERGAKLLGEARLLPPGPERDSFVKEIEQLVASFEALKTKAK